VIRVFVVDDSAFIRKALTRVLSSHPDCRVVGEAANGDEALRLIPKADPDVVTLDIAMHGMDGLATLKALLAWRPSLPVIMLSAHTREGAEATLDALALGAVDFIDKTMLNLMDLDGLREELVGRLQAFRRKPGTRSRTPVPVPRKRALVELGGLELCIIGASTGGPAALQQILERLPEDFPLPVAVVQHMPPGFTKPFADRLDSLCRLEVREPAEGDRLRPGQVFIAPAGRHLRLGTNLNALLSTDAQGFRHVPSVDVLMKSADKVRRGKVLGVLLTGMGDDGADGMSVIRAHGGVTVAENEESCAVFGMPRAAMLRGAVDQMLSLDEIALALASLGQSVR
jgi:two-component system chemotaxis response regulator CheB